MRFVEEMDLADIAGGDGDVRANGEDPSVSSGRSNTCPAGSNFMSAHLTHEELTDNLLGVSSITVNAHLLNCPACTRELDGMKTSITAFRDAAHAWNERRSGHEPQRIDSTHPSEKIMGCRLGAGNRRRVAVCSGLCLLPAQPKWDEFRTREHGSVFKDQRAGNWDGERFTDRTRQ